MKNRIAPDLDQLMWTLAEDPLGKARQEFDARYPEYRLELARRCDMVRGLKGGRPSRTPAAVPTFSPRRSGPTPRQVSWTLGLGLGALAVASYTAVTLLGQPKEVVRPEPTPRTTVSVPANTPAVVFDNHLPNPNRTETPLPSPVDQTPPPSTMPAYLRPQNMSIKRAPLQTVLKLVAAQGKLGITIAPGLSNPDVAIQYEDKTVIEILQDLGRQYAFTAFDQGDGSVLIIPARDDEPAELSGTIGTKEDRRIR